ncbi:MAG: tetratricopeptide repeat protein [Chloroflexi bacterium]|nr:tetratricopeptide repeat protein [Chloroflexota bacterium]
MRGVLYLDEKDFDRALADLNKALQLSPNYDRAFYYRGLTYKSIGDSAKAIADFKQAASLTKDTVLRQKAQTELTKLGYIP